MKKVIIAGSRSFNDYELLKERCDYWLGNEIKIDLQILSGTANGADKLGEKYALERGYKVIKFPADWETYGKKAGYLRNKEMAKVGDILIAFWDGKSKGTKHMIDLAKEFKIFTILVKI
jgi:hypothetical protein